MQILFDDAQQISATSFGRDALRIVFKDTSKFLTCDDFDFRGRRSLKGIPFNYELFVSLPPQLQISVSENGETKVEEPKSLTNVLTEGETVQVAFSSSIVLNYVKGVAS